MTTFRFLFFLALALFLSACSNLHSDVKQETRVVETSIPVEVEQLREDIYLGNPEGETKPSQLSNPVNDFSDIIANDVYTSPYHGFKLKIPQIFGSNQLNVRHGLVSERPDGTPITSHVVFLSSQGTGAAGLVVTRIREEKIGDPAAILESFKPKNENEKRGFEKKGILYTSYQGKYGEILEREVHNRVYTRTFPYRIYSKPASDIKSLGISRFYVKGDYFYEFTVLLVDDSAIPKGQSLHDAAQKQLDILADGMIKHAGLIEAK